MYSVKEVYYTLQGEGAQTGRPAVFLRFAGCNLWTGKEEGLGKAICKFCDTQFVGTDGENGGHYTATDLAEKVNELWGSAGRYRRNKYVVLTGGEPSLQLDEELLDALHGLGFEVAIETNGTKSLDGLNVDWICVSPKADAELKQTWGNELKLVYPQPENDPEDFRLLGFGHFFLQPKDDPRVDENVRSCVEYCLSHPQWKLSLQTHKILELK
jgi:7-carboxy-7-deazaguanine synthase (Cx14CxxC type)